MDSEALHRSSESSIGKLDFSEWLASLRTEYNNICRYRLEWARTGHSYGLIILPISLTVPAVLYGAISDPQTLRIAMLIGFLGIWVLLIFWRWYGHYIDRQIRLLYPRAIEIEEILGIKMTRTWLQHEWKLDHSPTIEDARSHVHKKFDLTRGHSHLDKFAGFYIIVTAIIAAILFLT